MPRASTVVESLFAFLFKYRPLLFEQGQVGIDERPPLLVAVIVAGTAALTVLSYRTAKADVRWRDRTILMALRVSTRLPSDAGRPVDNHRLAYP